MNDQRPVEDRIRSWLLETAPGELPDRVFDATFEVTRPMSQVSRVRPWTPTTSIARLAAAGIAVAVLVGSGLYLAGPNGLIGGTPTAVPTPSAAPTATPETSIDGTIPEGWSSYVSDRFAYSIERPADWIVTPATTDWPGQQPPFPDGPMVDRFAPSAEAQTYVIVSSDRLTTDQVAADRIAAVDSVNASNEGGSTACQATDRHAITLDGVEARQEDLYCFGSDHLVEVVVVSEDRIYLLDLFSTAPLTTTDRATFDRFLTSFRFGASPSS